MDIAIIDMLPSCPNVIGLYIEKLIIKIIKTLIKLVSFFILRK